MTQLHAQTILQQQQQQKELLRKCLYQNKELRNKEQQSVWLHRPDLIFHLSLTYLNRSFERTSIQTHRIQYTIYNIGRAMPVFI